MARHASHPHLDTNSHGYHTIVWTDNGRSKRKTTGTKDAVEAQQVFAAWLKQRHVPNAKGQDWTVGELIDTYFDEKIDGGPSHERTAIIATNLKNAFGGMKPADLDAAAMLRYGRERAHGLHGRRKANDSTVRRELTVLIACLNHAVRQRKLKADDFPHISRPYDGDAKDTVIPADHLEKILGGSMGRLHWFIQIAYETASRRAAVENLRWRQVDLVNKIVTFEGGSNTKKTVAVPMSKKLVAVFTHLADGRRHLDENGFVLWDNRSSYPEWAALMKRLENENGDGRFADYTPHDLRRTWATNAARRGVSLFDIAGMLGDSVAVVEKHYAKHCPAHLRRAVE